MFNIGLYREQHEKIFLSETTRSRALLFGMQYHLVDLHLVCSNNTPGAQKWPRQGGHKFYRRLYREQHEKIFLSETTITRALIFGM